MFLNQEKRNRKQKRVFLTFQDKKHILIFWIHQKGEKEKQSWKEESKKRRVIKTRNHFSRHRTRPNMEKKPKRKGNRENEFFLRWKKKEFRRSLKRYFHTKSLTWRNIEIKKTKKNGSLKREKRWKKRENKRRQKKREQMERGWTKRENKEVKKTLQKGKHVAKEIEKNQIKNDMKNRWEKNWK